MRVGDGDPKNERLIRNAKLRLAAYADPAKNEFGGLRHPPGRKPGLCSTLHSMSQGDKKNRSGHNGRIMRDIS